MTLECLQIWACELAGQLLGILVVCNMHVIILVTMCKERQHGRDLSWFEYNMISVPALAPALGDLQPQIPFSSPAAFATQHTFIQHTPILVLVNTATKMLSQCMWVVPLAWANSWVLAFT